MDKNHLILRINGIVRSVEAAYGLGDLDIMTRSILSFIGEAEADSQTLNVSDVVKAEGYGTAPNVYSRLAELEKSGWMRCIPDPHDRRAKLVQLTPLARRTYAKMSKEVLKLTASRSA